VDLHKSTLVERATDNFSAIVVVQDDACVVMLSGELDMVSAPELARVLNSVPESGPAEVVLDFSKLSFIDSSGIAVLMEAQNRLEESDRRLSVHSARRHAMRVFEISGLLGFLNVAPTEEAPTNHRA
jgi:anti-anti-sigma factor